MMQLPADITLRDIRTRLADDDAYVRRVFGVMHRATRDHGDIAVRLGITGTGKIPNYRIETIGNGKPLFAVDGATHERWPDDYGFAQPGNWSAIATSYAEVRALLGEMRGFADPSVSARSIPRVG